MGFIDACKTLWSIISWVWANPILALICGVGAILLMFGLVYSIRSLLRPSTWGIGKSRDLEPGQKSASIFTAVAAILLLAAIGVVGYICIFSAKQYLLIGDDFTEMAMEIDSVIDGIALKGRDLNLAMVSLNDSMVESYMDLLGHEGEKDAANYASNLEKSLKATVDLVHKTERYDRLVSKLRQISAETHRYRLDPAGDGFYQRPIYVEEQEIIRKLTSEIGYMTEWLADSLESGTILLEKFVRRAQRYLPDVAMEARQIKSAMQHDISAKLKKDGSKNLLPIVDTAAFDAFVAKVRGKTTKQARETASKVRNMAYYNIILASTVLLLGIGALFVNRFNYHILGLISVAGFVMLLLTSVYSNALLQGLSNQLASTCKILYKKDNDSESMVLTTISGTTITAKNIQKLLSSCKNNSNALYAIRNAFGDKESNLFNKKLTISDNAVAIALNKENLFPFPLKNEEIGVFYASAHAAALEKLTKNGELLKTVLEDYKHNADLCADQSKIAFPDSWHTSFNIAKNLLDPIDSLFTLHRKLKYDLAHMEDALTAPVFAKNIDEPNKEFPLDAGHRTRLRNLEKLTIQVSGTMAVVIELSEKLMSSCKAQQNAIKSLSTTNVTGLAQVHRLGMLEKKATDLVSPIVDCTFIVKPATECIERACGPTREKINSIGEKSAFLSMALAAVILSALFLTRFLNIMMKGLLFIFPCLEILRVFK